ncbi:hypothetical protein M569_11684, partial [Genlisea aurea]
TYTHWILDTGASDHMTHQLHLLSDLCETGSSSITMPNGRREIAHKSGTVTLGPLLSLHDVIYVPNF